LRRQSGTIVKQCNTLQIWDRHDEFAIFSVYMLPTKLNLGLTTLR
jgi:hypothetical protein